MRQYEGLMNGLRRWSRRGFAGSIFVEQDAILTLLFFFLGKPSERNILLRYLSQYFVEVIWRPISDHSLRLKSNARKWRSTSFRIENMWPTTGILCRLPIDGGRSTSEKVGSIIGLCKMSNLLKERPKSGTRSLLVFFGWRPQCLRMFIRLKVLRGWVNCWGNEIT